MMSGLSAHHTAEAKRNPLIPVGFVVFAVLVIPTVMYSIGPDGPIKKDHVVFSTGQHRAYFEDDASYQAFGYRGYCMLQPRDQLLVVESAEARSDGTYLAQKVGTRKRAFPFCPLQSKVILYEHQITLQPDMWGAFQDAFGRLFSADERRLRGTGVGKGCYSFNFEANCWRSFASLGAMRYVQ